MGDMHKSPRRKADKAIRHAEWLDEYIRGLSLRKIAAKHGVSKSAVHQAVQNQLRAAIARRDDSADTLLEQQVQRLDWLWTQSAQAINEARDGREVGLAQLISAARGVIDSKTKLLGLDQPQRHEVVVAQVSEIDRELAGLAELLRDNALAAARDAGLETPSLPVLDGIVESVTIDDGTMSP